MSQLHRAERKLSFSLFVLLGPSQGADWMMPTHIGVAIFFTHSMI